MTRRFVGWAIALSGIIGFLMACLATSGCQVLSAPASPPPPGVGPALVVQVNLEAEVLWPTVQLKAREGQWGTGVIVGWDGQTARILSAAHLFEDQPDQPVTVYVVEPAPWAFEAHLVWQAGDVDLALLAGEPAPGLIPSVARLYPPAEAAGLKRFAPVIGVGAPPRMQWLLPTSGWISQLEPRPIVTSIAWFGSSGGPIFLKHEGYWKVWAVTRGIPHTQGPGFSSWITNLVFVTPIAGWLGELNDG